MASRPSGHKMRQKNGRKLERIQQSLQKSGITLSEHPTNVLFVSNSSVMVGVSIESLEELFHKFDSNCTFFVYPTSKSYSFVQFSDVSKALKAKDQLDGTKPETFPNELSPIALFFVDKFSQQTQNKIAPNGFINGLKVIPEFISEQFESELIEFIERKMKQSIRLKNRRVIHFGFKFNYDANNALESAEEPIPPILDGLIDKIMDLSPTTTSQLDRPDQITVNVYESGQGIPPHTDTHSAFAEPIYSLSLCSDVVIEFRDVASTSKRCDVLLDRRSLIEMTSDARYRFKHGIMSRKYDVNPRDGRLIRRQKRISITFRKISRQRCRCPFIEFCDWDRKGLMRVPSSDEQGECLEREYVEKVYDRIADHFDRTRHSNWAGVSAFLNSLPPNTLLLDVGCGNGKYLARSDKLVKFGCDLSTNLLKIASGKGCTVFRADALELPIRDGAFDAAISIAVIHHFSTTQRRRKAISEILKTLRPGGLACVTAWAFDQTAPGEQTESIYMAKMRANKQIAEDGLENGQNSTNMGDGDDGKLRIHDGRRFAQQDMLVPWASIDAMAATHDFRYYHLFVRGELVQLLEEFGSEVELIREEYDEGNWVVVFRRKYQ